MKSMQDMVKRDIERYMNVGFSLESAAKQIKAQRCGHWDQVVDQVVEAMNKSSQTQN